MKKLLVLVVLVSLVLSAALAEDSALTVRSGVRFGMSRAEVLSAEGNVRAEEGRKHVTRGVVLEELELDDVTDSGAPADITYYFEAGRLAAVLIDYDGDDGLFDRLKSDLTARFGDPARPERQALGNGLYLVDDDGRLSPGALMWRSAAALIVLERDDDEAKLILMDRNAAFLR